MKSQVLVLILFLIGCPEVSAQSSQGGTVPSLQRAGFSSSVAISDGTIFVGESANRITSGYVHVYTRDGNGEWIEGERLVSEEAHEGDGFGAAMAVSGSRLVVAASRQNAGAGAVYVFELSDEGRWIQRARLSAADVQDGDGFGSSLVLAGNVLLVGAANQNSDLGSVYAFEEKASGNWENVAKLVASDGAEDDLFGASMAIAGNTAFIGSPGKQSREGVVYVYERSGENWNERGAISAFGIARNSRFGTSLSAEGESLVVGASHHQRSTGAAFLFSREDGDWKQTGTLLPFDGAPNNRFGTSVWMTSGNVWVGAPGANQFTGAVFNMERDEHGWWISSRKISPHDSTPQTMFGSNMAVEGPVAVVAQPMGDAGSGTAVVFEYQNNRWVEVATLRGVLDALVSITGNRVDCQDGKASRFECESIDMLSFLSIQDLGGERGVNLNDVWGWTDPETGIEWALVGRTDGTSFVDISNPSMPRYVGDLMLTEGAMASSWRDIKVYRDHAFIVADNAGSHGIQIFDLRRLRDVTEIPTRFSADTVYDGVHSVHNIVINEETGFAYAVGSGAGGETCGGGLHMINIQDPKTPLFAGCFSDTATGRSGTGYSHDAMCVVYRGPDAAHQGREICFGANETALSIADVTDKSNPKAVSSASYPNVSYAHQGWITDDHKYFYLDDELDELQGRTSGTRTLIWDITDLDDPQLVKEHRSLVKASDHNLYIRGNLMYQSNYAAGLRVFDITDPINPTEIGHFDTQPFGTNNPGFSGSWSNYPYFKSGSIIVTDIEGGLFIVKRQEADI